jgi:alpha-amylase/alpha-mannosidase (GH57 family)
MRYVCVHSHCYQPPREDPWTNEVERELTAWPFHDWNERIAADCYTPNTAARILNGDPRKVKTVNNYSRTSFDYGPTLLAWLEKKAPDTYKAICQADRESSQRFSGHGSAMAHAYNHVILPLANSQDKVTQILWGIQDFVHRFGRQPEGMWLAETAVDLESLEIMASHGIKFTLLSPRQAKAVRVNGTDAWQDVTGGRIDPSQAYRLYLPSGKSISMFFYDGPVSQAVSFEGLLHNGEKFAARLLTAYASERGRSELVHVVTDGEVYGHHHAHGEMALAFALEQLESRGLALITNYGEFLEKHPPSCEVAIIENTSWSCAHGVDRWRRHCGCHLGRGDWNQEWRAHLRDAMDWLRDEVADLYERKAAELVEDAWVARDDYIQVLLDRSDQNWTRFQCRHCSRALSPAEEETLSQLLELQRHAILMYTSCGWFFDDLSGIETRQVIGHAARVVELAEALFHISLEAPLLERLERAKSNVEEHGSGAAIYKKVINGRRAGVHVNGNGRDAKHWLHVLMNDLTEQFLTSGEMTFETMERVLQQQKEAYRSDLETARRMYRTYPHLFEESRETLRTRAAGV